MTPSSQPGSGTTIERTLDTETVDPGASTTVTIDIGLGTGTAFFALYEGFSPTTSDTEVISVTLDGADWASAIVVPGPDAIAAFYGAESDGDLAAGSTIELVYEITTSEAASQHELSGLLKLIEAGGNDEERTYTLGTDTVFVGEGIAVYADDDGIIRASGLNQAVRDYLSDDLSGGLLNDVIQAYLLEEPVT